MADDLGRLRLSESACVLQVDSSANKEEIRPGEEPNDTSSQSSCSGFIVDPREGFILTTGGLFSQVLPAADLQNGIVKGDSHPQGYGIKVFWETKRRGRLKSCRCRLVGLWSCDALADSLNRLFRKSAVGASKERSRRGGRWDGEEEQRCGGIGGEGCQRPREGYFLAVFVCLDQSRRLTVGRSLELLHHTNESYLSGNYLAVTGTPFGSLCPSAFVGSYTGGVVTNLTGKGDVVLLTDARCLPGTEGAAVFLEPENTEEPVAVGLVVAPMCFRTNQWLDYRSCAPSTKLYPTCLKSFRNPGHFYLIFKTVFYRLIKTGPRCHNFLNSIQLVKVGSSWGSGVVVDSERKFLLTCRHVVLDAINKNNTVVVRVDRETNSWCRAKVIFATSKTSVIDFAIIQLVGRHRDRFPLTEVELSVDTREGERLFAVGFPLFSPETRLSASVTSGHVSKVIYYQGQPVMMQTSCGVHPGSSGGALISQRTGKLVGIIANNCRDDTHSVTIPHLNFAIPNSVFLKPLKKFLRTGDLEHLDALTLSHELDYVVAQQRELEDMLIPLEESVRNTEGATYTQHTDLERERTYQMAETVDSQLKRMVQDLKEIIEHMNTVNTPRDSTDPLAQIAKILNAHMNSLQWIDQTTNSLQGKVEDVSRIYELVKRDQERNVHLAFD
ncbi:putative peroxisomal leader peptide-processing protease-like [Apostichopus japonicus]|uniref:Peroxisomal leader peptide-processing protease n=1 Tax=Stichopus japonicus TaxID=307972 RepID=A0A2G8KJI7_STIJA|nr:putative peroxisomal leader peptide-processing protease-like [Apostichopus japonicus]